MKRALALPYIGEKGAAVPGVLDGPPCLSCCAPPCAPPVAGAAPRARGWLDEADNRIGRSAAADAGGAAEELTDRELSILRMLPGTATQREIGAALFLSINTVKAYNESLYRKLGVGGRQDAVRAARRLGLI
ncbi:MAG: LuxR C-terminal-related transcriptional regulator [Actinoplanes sp.]